MTQGCKLQSERTDRAIQKVDQVLHECDRRKIDPIKALETVIRKWDERKPHSARDAKRV